MYIGEKLDQGFEELTSEVPVVQNTEVWKLKKKCSHEVISGDTELSG